ncbi:MAG: carboxypeptidase-like regulatory domain-containing protein [Pseudomonadota bacterium]
MNHFFKLVFFSLLLVSIAASAQTVDLDALVEEIKQQKTQSNSRFLVGEELIFSVTVDKHNLGVMDATLLESGLAFDLDAYANVLNFPIVYTNTAQAFLGWYINEQNSFSLSLSSAALNQEDLVVTLTNRTVTIPAQNYLFEDDKLFISQSVLEDIFGIRFTIDEERLVAAVLNGQQLPFLSRLARQKGQTILRSSSEPSFINLTRGYEILSPQIFDFRTNAFYSENNNEYQMNYSLQGARDIALWSTNLSLTGSDDDWLNASRLTFSRQSEEGQIFGDTGLTNFQFGDIRGVQQLAGSGFNEALGVRFSNNPVNNDIENNVIQIDGDVPIGWDVELYRNNVLLRQEFAVETGRYNFLDVPLIFGANNFEVLLYGPQGQVRKRTISRLIDENTLVSKPFTYQVAFVDSSRALINSSIDDRRIDRGYALSSRARVGLGQYTSADVSLLNRFGIDNGSNTLGLGINTLLFNNVLFSSGSTFSDQGRWGVNMDARTNVYGQSLSLSTRYDTFENNTDQYLASLGLSGHLPLFEGIRLPLSQQVTYQDSADSQIFRYSNRLGVNLGRISLFNNMAYEKITSDTGSDFEKVFGGLNAQLNLGNMFIRGGVTLDSSEPETVSSAQMGLAWHLSQRFRANLNYQKDFANDFSQGTVFLSYFGDNFNLSSRFGYSETRGYDVGLNASFSLSGQSSVIDTISNNALPQSTSGSLAVRVFLDNNLNYVFDEGDELLPEVKVQAVQFFKNELTDDTGVAILERLPNLRSSDIVVDRDTLPDLFMAPSVEGVSITTRSGLADFLDYPISPVSEITGIVEIENEGNLSPGARLVFDLKDAKNKVVGTAKSEFDGYYTFIDVKPGSYTIELNESSRERYDLQPYSIRVESPHEPDIINRDLTVQSYRFQRVYVSEVASFNNNRFAPIAFVGLKKQLDQRGVNLLRYSIPNQNMQIFYTQASSSESNITQICDLLLLAKIPCKPTEVFIKIEEQS